MKLLRRALLAILAILAANPLAVQFCAPRYETLAPDAAVVVAGRPEPLGALARRYAPTFFDDPAVPCGPLRELLYEARAEGGRLSIVYRTVWDDERHPVAAIDHPYRLFRRFYFGTAVDVEYVRIDVALATGAVAALDYQTEPSLSAREMTSAHLRVTERDPALPIELYAVSWNHMVSRLGRGLPGRTWVRAEPALLPVTDEDRRRLWLARATYSSLPDFGPLKLYREAPVYVLALALAFGLERIITRRRRSLPRRTAPPAAGP